VEGTGHPPPAPELEQYGYGVRYSLPARFGHSTVMLSPLACFPPPMPRQRAITVAGPPSLGRAGYQGGGSTPTRRSLAGAEPNLGAASDLQRSYALQLKENETLRAQMIALQNTIANMTGSSTGELRTNLQTPTQGNHVRITGGRGGAVIYSSTTPTSTKFRYRASDSMDVESGKGQGTKRPPEINSEQRGPMDAFLKPGGPKPDSPGA
jgi:hypothetical protein